MDKSQDTRNRDENRNDRRQEADEKAVGDVLGVSRVPAGGGEAAGAGDEVANQPPTKEERDHIGSRDVTDGTTGGTGPDTGGSGVLRRGSGATGTDIGR